MDRVKADNSRMGLMIDTVTKFSVSVITDSP